jgi:putative intracellular protease/amidase
VGFRRQIRLCNAVDPRHLRGRRRRLGGLPRPRCAGERDASPTARHLVAGKTLAAFTDEEEAEVGYTTVVPYLLATTLKTRGALHQAAPNWSEQVVTDGCLVTGQNPASAHGVGKAVADQLKAKA